MFIKLSTFLSNVLKELEIVYHFYIDLEVGKWCHQPEACPQAYKKNIAVVIYFDFKTDPKKIVVCLDVSCRKQGCIFRLTCSHPELTEDHVLIREALP